MIWMDPILGHKREIHCLSPFSFNAAKKPDKKPHGTTYDDWLVTQILLHYTNPHLLQTGDQSKLRKRETVADLCQIHAGNP